jgi:hypothetical protein
MSNQAYLQGVAEALSQLNVDPQIKVASYNELEKIAIKVPQGVTNMLSALKGSKANQALQNLRASTGVGVETLGKKVPAAMGGDAGRLGQFLQNRAIGVGDTALALGGTALTGAGLYGINAVLDDSDEIAAAELAAAELADAERQRNLALALGGTALASGLGYGAYKALS